MKPRPVRTHQFAASGYTTGGVKPQRICATCDGPLRRLVPDPADDAPPLPFEIHDDTGHTALRVTLWPSLDKPRTGAVSVLGNYAELTADELKATAAALLRAAREVEQR